jgi:hypothetical protein
MICLPFGYNTCFNCFAAFQSFAAAVSSAKVLSQKKKEYLSVQPSHLSIFLFKNSEQAYAHSKEQVLF